MRMPPERPADDSSLATRRFGPDTLQAAISAVHAGAASPDETDWNEIVSLYSVLLQIDPSPVVELNRAVATAMRDGPLAGIAAIEDLLARRELSGYHLAYSAQGELLRRAGRIEPARRAFEQAFELARQEPERRLLRQKLAELNRPEA